jgi:hypothetical protein
MTHVLTALLAAYGAAALIIPLAGRLGEAAGQALGRRIDRRNTR